MSRPVPCVDTFACQNLEAVKPRRCERTPSVLRDDNQVISIQTRRRTPRSASCSATISSFTTWPCKSGWTRLGVSHLDFLSRSVHRCVDDPEWQTANVGRSRQQAKGRMLSRKPGSIGRSSIRLRRASGSSCRTNRQRPARLPESADTLSQSFADLPVVRGGCTR